MKTSSHKEESFATIERAMVAIRRDQQRRRLQRQRSPDETPAQSLANAARFRYLDALEAAPSGMSITGIADAIGVDQPRASRLTNDLVNERLVARVPDPLDGRRSIVTLTAEGRAIVDAATTGRRRMVEAALESFSDEERDQFARLLGRFVEAWPR